MRKINTIIRSISALTLCVAMLSVDAFAVVREVSLWGARSINDMGGSDRRITMDELKEDYSGYLQTDGMTEFFHKDQSPSPKTDMTEALAWLIDNNIINRDETITVSNIDAVPSVSITKSDITSRMFYNVKRSDALMYIYKAVFGPLPGRTIGVETPSVRTDDGVPDLFANILEKHKTEELGGIYIHDKYDGDSGKQEEYENIFEGIFIEEEGNMGRPGAGSGSPGGAGGGADNEASYENDALTWRYTPQGDEYTSIFGDTNVFISENHFNQGAFGGDGGMGGTGVSGGTLNSGVGGEGGAGGLGGNIINYETDYKQIYFVPGSDLLFYRTDDVIEMYLQSLWSKGLLSTDKALRTVKFEDTFIPYTVDGAAIAAWSGQADPYVVNLSRAKHIRIENVSTVSSSDILGTNYSVRSSGSSVTITRANMFNSNTGYFVSEELSRMDVYRYIYTMVYANEKKLSDLERDIVSYKYGMEFDGIASSADIEVLKYLIAKGILNFEDSSELSNLYTAISWYDFIPILYRVANDNARLDFSVVQLTDSDQAWKANGFSQQTVQFVENGSIGSITVEYSDGYLMSIDGEQDTSDDNDASQNTGGIAARVASALGATHVHADTASVGTATYRVENSGAMTFSGYYFDFTGAQYSTSSIVSEFSALLSEIDSSTKEQLLDQTTDGFDASNPKHKVVGYILKNIYAIAAIRTDGSIYSEMKKALDEWKSEKPDAMSGDVYELKKMVAGYFQNMLESARTGEGAPQEIVFVGADGIRINAPNAGEGDNTFASNLKAIEFSFKDSNTGAAKYYTYAFNTDLVSEWISQGTDVVSAVNGAAVEFTKEFTNIDVQEAGGLSGIEQEMASQIGTTLATPSLAAAGGDTSSFLQQVDENGESAFVSWKSIEQAMSDDSLGIHISRVSDVLLYNADTDTYAYFGDKDANGKATALVGTEVIIGDPDLGVAYQAGAGEAATMYYYTDAICALINANQASSLISGIRGVELTDAEFDGYVNSLDLVSEGGAVESSISGVRCLLSVNYDADVGSYGNVTAFAQSTRVGSTLWGDYFTLSQANRVLNIISRKLKYTSTTGNENCVAYAVVRFVPVDAQELGSSAITENSSLQDLLDAPAKAPDNAAAKAIWTSNKAACNAYANWIYGTANATYIETGYLRPEATVYVVGDKDTASPPVSVYKPLTNAQIATVNVVSMSNISKGACISLETTPTVELSTAESNACTYWLSNDYNAVVSNNRIYLHKSLFTNLSVETGSNGKLYAKVNNIMARQASFSPGSTFKVAGVADVLGNGIDQPNIIVVATSEDGTITCQVGPITGVPIIYGGAPGVISGDIASRATTTARDLDFHSVKGDNRIITTHNEMFSSMVGVIRQGVTEDPVFTAVNLPDGCVFTGDTLMVYDSNSKPIGEVPVPVATANQSLAEYVASIREAADGLLDGIDLSKTQTYETITFPASKFSVKDGKLVYGESSAMEFLSPSLFTSLNDLIIDDMINKSTGAIPVNEVPEGSMLKVGNSYYQAVGASTDVKSFIGYAFLDSYSDVATLQDAAPAFASQFIRAGNQYMNVSHWFKDGTRVLGSEDETIMNALTNVAAQTMSIDGSEKRSLDANGNIEVIVASTVSSTSSMYCPIQIVFYDGLYAYKTSDPNSSGAPMYTLSTSADNAIAGVFSNLPFYTNSVMEAGLYDITTDTISATFSYYEGAPALMKVLQDQFRKAFAGDLIVLARMLLFSVLCWLVVASWVCYVCRIANLTTILEAIRYPSRDRSRRGIDLMKVISLGTINLDTEFTLGRFLQYEVILAALICVVMLTSGVSF